MKVPFPDIETARCDEEPLVAEQRAKLVVLGGPTRGEALDLPATDGEVRIGKAADNALCLPDATVSRYHCTLRRDATGWLLTDLDSTNGTFLDEARIKQTYLRPGATFRVGNVSLRLATEFAPLLLEPSASSFFGSLVGESMRMREVFALLERIADSDAPVLITGETGSGKGAVARAIHEQSKRAAAPFVVVDCAAVAANLIESELFGHERGAFTSADQRRVGALELAHDGTLFLDELDDLRKDLQPKLLRVLEERTFHRVGSGQVQRFNARVIAASKKNVRALVEQGRLRDDLYFRLAIFQVDLPALRQRKEDLAPLIERFAGAGAWSRLPTEVRARLASHSWPGNIRELRNAIDRALALGGGDLGRPELWNLERGVASSDPLDLDFARPFKDVKARAIDRIEREYLTRLLARCDGNITACAREADLARRHLYTLLEKHGLHGRDEPPPDDEE
jgi:DNA-binding NtrC family response regulator